MDLIHHIADQHDHHRRDHRTGCHHPSVLGGGHMQFLGGEEQIESMTADGRRVVQRGSEKQECEERMAVALPEVDFHPVHQPLIPWQFRRLKLLRRRVLPLFHKYAHQHEADQIQQPDAGEDHRRVIDHIGHHKQIEQQPDNGSGEVQRRHEPADELVRDHIGEHIIIDRADNQVEELENHRENADQQNTERIHRHSRDEMRVQIVRDRRHPADQDHEQRNERSRRNQIRDAPAPAGAGPVAGGGEDRIHHEIHRRRNAADHQPDQRSGGVELLHGQRQQRRNQRTEQPEDFAAEDHPRRHHDHAGQRITQCSDRIGTPGILRRRLRNQSGRYGTLSH